MRWMTDPTATNDDTVAFPPSPLGSPNPHRRHGYDGRHGHDGYGDGYGDGYELGKPPPEPRPGEGDARQIFAHRTPRLGTDKPYGRPDSSRPGPSPSAPPCPGCISPTLPGQRKRYPFLSGPGLVNSKLGTAGISKGTLGPPAGPVRARLPRR